MTINRCRTSGKSTSHCAKPLHFAEQPCPEQTIYTVLDLKDTFFSLSLAPVSQPLFTFEWHSMERGFNEQLTWTLLPQGFKNSLTMFNEALHEDLGESDTTTPSKPPLISSWLQRWRHARRLTKSCCKNLVVWDT